MATIASPLPLSTTYTPASPAEVVETVRSAVAARAPIYPLGGRTALGFGSATKASGWGLSTEKLTRVVDYPARDMTITVEAGITLAELRQTLAAERQYLPVDASQATEATLGGLIAVNFSGPRRFGNGTLRDYVIGISAVDGTGTLFKAGGRVVKNVAGYDFCRLLIGSLGTLAVMTQVTLKVKPIPAASVLAIVDLDSASQAESLLSAIIDSKTTPTAIELLAGHAWNDLAALNSTGDSTSYRLVVGLEGTDAEVEWMTERLRQEWKTLGVAEPRFIRDAAANELWQRLIDFGCTPAASAGASDKANLVFKLNVPPSRVVSLCELVRATFPQASFLARAGSGIILVSIVETASHELVKPLIQALHPAVAAVGGQCVLWQSVVAEEFTRQLAWGPLRGDIAVMRKLQRQFDPHGLLNPGRFPW
ncbi:MAG: FAD-binding oxidoreductase [Planctomycetia bacterium]|nr:FAD-binding oxidoreductase [Planctomycetia bacterium]